MRFFGSGTSGLLWIVFGIVALADPGLLTSTWGWVQGLHIVLEVIIWIVFLPWMLGLWIAQSSLDLWLRVVLVVIVAMAFTGALSSRGKRVRRSRR